ncbi:MAG TPA: type II toxin-antitoxin system VapC family toxin [Rhizomicrobium sp.]|nr:type II toxin-antitoxin system VapC family toxin [Rhizomicrobium sp.]
MIAVDTSALIAILWGEKDEHRLRARLEAADGALVSTASLLELQLVIAGVRSKTGWREAEALLRDYEIRPRAFNERQLEIARDAVLRFGKGRHKAGLNFGDCFAYALAISEDIPLLFTGKDFAHTDVTAA